MKFISKTQDGVFDFTNYEKYLDERREQLATLIVGGDLLAQQRFELQDRGSFHDARLESVVVTSGETVLPGRDDSWSGVELWIKGPYFDRFFVLNYDEVASCKIDVPSREDDLLIHELRLENDRLVHELLFDKDRTIEIVCRTIRFKEILSADAEKLALAST